MEGLNRIQYGKIDVADMEDDVGYVVKQTISQGINDGGVLAFRLPPDPERFTDLNTLLLRLEVGIQTGTGLAVGDDKIVCLEPGGMHSIFSSCEVRFNEEVVSTMTAYPYTAVLSRHLGCAKEIRDGIMDTLDGTYPANQDVSHVDITETNKASLKKRKARISNNVLIGRIFSDILMSSRQYLPPGVSLGIDLRRAHDHFSLISPETDSPSYKVVIKTASIYARRLKLRPSLIPQALESARDGGGINFNRLETRLMAISRGAQVFRWLDCLNSAPLPNRLYVGFVAQKSLYGSLTQLSTLFEPLNMSSLNVKLNGRDLLVEPIRASFVRDVLGKLKHPQTDAMEGFLTITEVLNMVGDQNQSLRINYDNYCKGMTVYAIELGKCGEKSGSAGCLDLELTFGDNGAELDACIMLFAEKSERAQFHPRPT